MFSHDMLPDQQENILRFLFKNILIRAGKLIEVDNKDGQIESLAMRWHSDYSITPNVRELK